MLPKLLYELMPVLYVAVGFSAALLLYNSYAILSGILLLIVGLVILYMRLESRTEAMERLEHLYTLGKKR
jgi:putative Mn2+ efflux pump MntP